MNKKVLATALLCFSLLFSAFSVVPAASSALKPCLIYCDVATSASDTSLSIEELLALPSYVTPAETTISSDVDPRPTDPENWRIRMPAPVDVMIVVDNALKTFVGIVTLNPWVDWNAVDEWACNVLELGDDPFESSFNINFVAQDIKHWDSPSGTLSQLLDWAQQTFGKPLGIDVTFVLTGRPEPGLGGWAEKLGDAFIVSAPAALDYLCPIVNIWQHEASHLYGAPDHAITDLLTVCIMSGWWVEATRSWCSGCSSTISTYKYRFGTIYIR